MNAPEISIVSPCFNEEENIPRLYSTLTAMLETMNVPYELVLVENGSSDRSMQLLSDIAATDPRVKVIQLSRNFGYQGGISAGMAYASGNYLVSIDADLQDSVELIPQMYEKASREGYDVVYGIRRSRKEGFAKRASYRLFYRLMRWLTPFELPLDAGDFAMMNRKVLEAVRSLPEKDRFLRGLRAWVGFRTTGIPYGREARVAGRSKFSVGALFLIAFQGLFSFSFMPVRLLFYLGILVCALIFPMIGGYFVWRLVEPSAWPPGTATIIILLLANLGMMMAGIGMLGEYLAIVFIEVKRRPTFIPQALLNVDPNQSSPPCPVCGRGQETTR